jgi:hypothetical protein
MLLDMVEPDSIPKDLLVFMAHDLELRGQLEFFGVNLKNPL